MGTVKHWLAAKTSSQRLNLFASMHIGVSLPTGTERFIVCQKVRLMSTVFVLYHHNPKGIGFSRSYSVTGVLLFWLAQLEPLGGLSVGAFGWNGDGIEINCAVLRGLCDKGRIVWNAVFVNGGFDCKLHITDRHSVCSPC